MKRNKILQLLLMCILSVVTSINLFAATTQVTTQKQTIKPVDVHFISTGNSDSILICDNGKYAMIDGADNDDEQLLVDYLNNLGIKQLDYLVLTHPDADHSGGLDAIVKNFTIKNVFVGNGKAETKTYKSFIQACMDKKLQPSVPLADKEFALGNGTFKFYNQTAQYDDVNDNSLVALYTNGSNKFLFTGDSGQEVEAKLPLKDIGKIDVLKVGHHGSRNSSSDAFIKAISPKYAVICCGKDNSYGHPHKKTTDTLNKYKVTTYRTDLNGTIVITSDGKNITVKTTTQANTTTNSTPTVANKNINNTATNKAINTTVVKQQNTSTTQPVTQTVYVTKTGKKYHKDGCSYLKDSKIAINLYDAKAKGYEPCSKCCK